MTVVVCLRQGGDHHAVPVVVGGRGVDELVAADVDAHMGGHRAVILEEHQVAGLQLAAGYGRTIAQLAGSAVGQLDAQLREDVHGEAGAVKAAGGGAAVYVGNAQILLRQRDDLAAGNGGGGVVRRCLVGRLGRRFLRRLRGGGVRRGGGADQHILGGHIAADAVVADGEPAALDTGDGEHRTVGRGAQRGAAAFRSGTDVQHVRRDLAGTGQAGGGVIPGDVLGGDVATGAVVGNAVPVALLDGQLHKGTLVQRLENVIAGACTAADADIRAGHHAQRLNGGGDGRLLLDLAVVGVGRFGIVCRGLDG